MGYDMTGARLHHREASSTRSHYRICLRLNTHTSQDGNCLIYADALSRCILTSRGKCLLIYIQRILHTPILPAKCCGRQFRIPEFIKGRDDILVNALSSEVTNKVRIRKRGLFGAITFIGVATLVVTGCTTGDTEAETTETPQEYFLNSQMH